MRQSKSATGRRPRSSSCRVARERLTARHSVDPACGYRHEADRGTPTTTPHAITTSPTYQYGLRTKHRSLGGLDSWLPPGGILGHPAHSERGEIT